MLGPAGHDRRFGSLKRAVTEVEGVLMRVQPLLGDRLQHLDLTRSVSRAEVLDLPSPTPIRVHDLDRDRPARGLHRPHIGHSDRLDDLKPSPISAQHPRHHT